MEPTADSSRTFRAVLGVTSNRHERTEVSITLCGVARVGYVKYGSNYVAASSTVWAVVRSEILCLWHGRGLPDARLCSCGRTSYLYATSIIGRWRCPRRHSALIIRLSFSAVPPNFAAAVSASAWDM